MNILTLHSCLGIGLFKLLVHEVVGDKAAMSKTERKIKVKYIRMNAFIWTYIPDITLMNAKYQ